MSLISKETEVFHSAGNLINECYLQSEAILQKANPADRLLTLPETKKLKEQASEIKVLEVTIDPGATMSIFIRLTEYIDKIDHQFAVKLVDFQKNYLRDELNLRI